MTITIISVTSAYGVVHAKVAVNAACMGASALFKFSFEPWPGSDAAAWREEAYDRALRMLDPA